MQPNVIFDGVYNECAGKIGDYPIITVGEAREQLISGKYISSSPYDFAGEEYIGGVELVYRSSMSELLVPYYLFYVELPEAPENKGMKNYASYYIPAVNAAFIEKAPYNGYDE